VSSIVYNGHDFGAYTTCTVVEGAHALLPTAKVIPGRAGELLLSGRIPPRVLRVKLFLDPAHRFGNEELSELKHRLYAWLACEDGAVLWVPGDPDLEWHDVICTGASPWTTGEGDASCELEFTCFDPIAYGDSITETSTAFTVGGTWPTWPVFVIEAENGDYLQVACGRQIIRVDAVFTGGEDVVIDCARETVTIDGVDARADVALSSEFFCLEPGDVSLAFANCYRHSVTYRERCV
jgi:phage-related protein